MRELFGCHVVQKACGEGCTALFLQDSGSAHDFTVRTGGHRFVKEGLLHETGLTLFCESELQAACSSFYTRCPGTAVYLNLVVYQHR